MRSLQEISGALHLPACRSFGVGRALFEQPGKNDFFRRLLNGFDALHFWDLLFKDFFHPHL
jgi:hypothetical protein